ncbi:bone marrow proteoglycan-like [Discoglossus pictus]
MFGLFFFLLFVGTICAQESGDDSLDNIITDNEPSTCNVQCETEDELENGIPNDCQMEECHNATVEYDENMALDKDKECSGKVDCPHYRYIGCARSFNWAARYCRCRRGNLSSIHNWHTNAVLARFAVRKNRRARFAWIGVRKTCRRRRYFCVDRSRLDYTNWACGQRKRCGAWCTAMNVYSGRWYSLRCHTRLPFFCTY